MGETQQSGGARKSRGLRGEGRSSWARARERIVIGERFGGLRNGGRSARSCQLFVPIWYIMIPQKFIDKTIPGSTAVIHCASKPCFPLRTATIFPARDLKLDTRHCLPSHLQLSSQSHHLLSLHPCLFCPLGSYLAIWTNCPLLSTSVPHFNYTSHPFLLVKTSVMAEIAGATASGGSKYSLSSRR